MATIYDRADSVAVTDRSPILNEKGRPGTYVLEFLGAVAGESKKSKKDYFKANFKVIKAEGDDAFQVGTEVAQFFNEDPYDYWIKDMKRLVAALTGTKASQVTGKNIEELTQADNPAQGILVRAKVAPKSEENSFMVVTFEPTAQE